MSETVILAIVNAVVAVVSSVTAGLVVWLKTRDAVRLGQSNSEGIREVHGIVNSKSDAQIARIEKLEKLLEQSQDARIEAAERPPSGTPTPPAP